MPWYKLPHTDTAMFFRGERPDLEPAADPNAKPAPKEKPAEKAAEAKK